MAITTRGIVSGLPSGGGEGGGPVSWADVTSKPTSFPTTWTAIADKPEVVTADMLAPVATSGSASDIADLPYPLVPGTTGQVLTSNETGDIVWSDAPAGAAPTWEDVTGKPAFGMFAELGNGTPGQTIVAGDMFGYPEWTDIGTGMSALVDDAEPMLGGPLDMNDQKLVGAFDIAKADGTAILQVIPGNTENQFSMLHEGAAGERLDIASYSGDVRIISTTGNVVIQGLAYPGADGADGDVLSTDGSGNLSWTAPGAGGGGIASVSEDLTPTLGGPLDVNGQQINGDLHFTSQNTWWSSGTQNVNLTNDLAPGQATFAHEGSAGSFFDLVCASGDIKLRSSYAGGSAVVQGLRFPAADGDDGQVLATDGAGNLEWLSPYTSPELINYRVPFVFLGSLSGSVTIDCDTSNAFLLGLGGDITTVTISNPVETQITIVVQQDGTGGHTITWPSQVKWPAGVPPLITHAANAVDVVVLIYNASLNIWLGSYQQAFA